MWFRRRSRLANVPPEGRGEVGEKDEQPEFYRVDFDAMLKGSVVMRRGKPIRQFGVTVDGSTRLVTSGDLVDRETYQALVLAGAIKPQTPTAPDASGSPPRASTPPLGPHFGRAGG
ncbi:MAG: hypothetical protein HY706_15525 [Candidatus Hydrogenedentes bacterium]|nr:hypothetical protein [Candidatus Hydrogenedentota bacterium]